MPTSVTLNIPNQGTREDLRKVLVEEFLNELPGTGTGNLTSNYIYYVENLASGNRIYLTRPAMLNKGFDFLVHVEHFTFQHGRQQNDAPAHRDIIDDLMTKRAHNLPDYTQLFSILQSIFRVQLVTPIQFAHLTALPGYPIDMIVGVVKWLFIEQDVTYWNWSGRQMFMDAIPIP
jgi:hypothetical protein